MDRIADFFEDFFEMLVNMIVGFITWLINLDWVKIIFFGLSFGLIFSAVSCGYNYFNADREGPWYDDQELSFVRGDIDDTGRVDRETKKAIYTKDMIPCDGLRVTLSFGHNYYYEIHYFTAEDKWISGELQYESGVYTVEPSQMPAGAAGIRIVILKLDGTDIGFWERRDAAKCLTLDVYIADEASADVSAA